MELVKVYNSISINELNFVKTLLEINEIDAVIFDETIASLAPHYLFHQGGARLMVREEDRERALVIINDYEKSKIDKKDS